MKKRVYLLVLVVVGLIFSLFLLAGSKKKIEENEPATSPGEYDNKSKMGLHRMEDNKEKTKLALKSAIEYGKKLRRSRKLPEEDFESNIHLIQDEIREELDPEINVDSNDLWEKGASVLQEILEEETEDYRWKDGVESEIRKMIDEQELLGTSLVDVHCGTSLCKARIDFDNEETIEKFHKYWRDHGPSEKGVEHGKVDELESGRRRANIYFSRKYNDEPFREMARRLSS